MKSRFNDSPLTYDYSQINKFDEYIEEKDILQIKDYALALTPFVSECQTPMTIGVQGDWGIGKTSMLNTVQAYLDRENRSSKRNNYGLIWVNTWHYSMFGQEEYLGLSVIKGILEQLQHEFELKEEESSVRKALGFAKNLIKNAQVSVAGVSVSAKNATEEESQQYDDISVLMKGFKDSLQLLVKEIVEQNKGNRKVERLVFFIDDLDRVKPVKALELLEVLKNFFDIEHCVFVLAVDYEVIQMGMQQKLGVDLQKKSGKSFFDKIIQLPFLMPSTSYNLSKYIQVMLNDIGVKVGDDESSFYEEVTSITVGRNPRSVKRVINYTKLIRIIRDSKATKDAKDSELQRKIIYSLICMQIAWPEIFAFFAKNPNETTIRTIENWDEQEKIPFIQKLYDRTPNVDLLKSNISAYFDLLFELTDENSDGSLSNEELKPIWDALYVSRLTTSRNFEEPFEIFKKMCASNSVEKSGGAFTNQLETLQKSKWIGSGEMEFQMSGKRYATFAFNRKQIGSLVTLKTRPLVFRVNVDDEYLKETLKAKVNTIPPESIDQMIYPVDQASLTGFGDTIIDLSALDSIEKNKQIALLNNLYNVVTAKFM